MNGVYAITPEAQDLQGFTLLLRTTEYLLQAGVRVLQYRDKSGDSAKRKREAQTLQALCRRHQAIFIINDDVVLAAAIGADGVHLGQSDLAIREARACLGPKACIGVSCYNELERALMAEASGADYVAFGSVFPSSVKPHAVRADLALLRLAKSRLKLPVVAIGGITLDNGHSVVATGVDAVAMISTLFASEDPFVAAQTAVRWFSE